MYSGSRYLQFSPDLVDDPPRISTRPVLCVGIQVRKGNILLPIHFINEGYPRNVVPAHLTIDRSCLALVTR